MFPVIGDVALYKLSESDVELINRRRTTSESVRNRIRRNPPEWPEGAQAHVGDPVSAGELLPLVVTKVDPASQRMSGQVLLNGSDTHFVAGVELVVDGVPAEGQAITQDDQLGLDVGGGANRQPKSRR